MKTKDPNCYIAYKLFIMIKWMDGWMDGWMNGEMNE